MNNNHKEKLLMYYFVIPMQDKKEMKGNSYVNNALVITSQLTISDFVAYSHSIEYATKYAKQFQDFIYFEIYKIQAYDYQEAILELLRHEEILPSVKYLLDMSYHLSFLIRRTCQRMNYQTVKSISCDEKHIFVTQFLIDFILDNADIVGFMNVCYLNHILVSLSVADYYIEQIKGKDSFLSKSLKLILYRYFARIVLGCLQEDGVTEDKNNPNKIVYISSETDRMNWVNTTQNKNIYYIIIHDVINIEDYLMWIFSIYSMEGKGCWLK